MDWRTAVVGVVVLIGISNLLTKKFFNEGGDWRSFAPVIFVLAVFAALYFGYVLHKTGWESRYNPRMSFYVVGITVCVLLAAVLTYFAYESGQASRVAPIIAMNGVITVLLAYLFLGENITLRLAVGVLLGIISIWLVSG
ncbi:MAG: EamA family transporter [Candidatus Micrarchaeia archaeon]